MIINSHHSKLLVSCLHLYHSNMKFLNTYVAALKKLLQSQHLSPHVFPLCSTKFDQFFQNPGLHPNVDNDWRQRAIGQLRGMINDVTVDDDDVQGPRELVDSIHLPLYLG